jgi:hypothetical protein
MTSSEAKEYQELRRKIYDDWLLSHSPDLQKLIVETQGTYDVERIRNFLKTYAELKYDNKSTAELRKAYNALGVEILKSTNLLEMVRKLKDFNKIKIKLYEKRPQDKVFIDNFAFRVNEKVGTLFISNLELSKAESRFIA